MPRRKINRPLRGNMNRPLGNGYRGQNTPFRPGPDMLPQGPQSSRSGPLRPRPGSGMPPRPRPGIGNQGVRGPFSPTPKPRPTPLPQRHPLSPIGPGYVPGPQLLPGVLPGNPGFIGPGNVPGGLKKKGYDEPIPVPDPIGKGKRGYLGGRKRGSGGSRRMSTPGLAVGSPGGGMSTGSDMSTDYKPRRHKRRRKARRPQRGR